MSFSNLPIIMQQVSGRGRINSMTPKHIPLTTSLPHPSLLHQSDWYFFLSMLCQWPKWPWPIERKSQSWDQTLGKVFQDILERNFKSHMLAILLKFTCMAETASCPPSSFSKDSYTLAEHIANLNKIYISQSILQTDLACDQVLARGIQVGLICTTSGWYPE